MTKTKQKDWAKAYNYCTKKHYQWK